MIQVNDSTIENFIYSDIEKVNLRIETNPGKVLIPALAGLAVGVGIGFALGSDNPSGLISYPAGEKALFLGVVGFGLGAAVGAILDKPYRKTFSIEGNRNKFHDMNLSFLKIITSKQ